jgi:class III poly(R)-hydroxyalkanoic acid synthase PhaE subunit
MLGRLPPVGLAREHTEAWRELAAAQAECAHLEQELREALLGVQRDALDLLEQRVREREAPIAGYRDLYNLWVECAEQVFAKVAHSDTYGRLQAELGNASMRLRVRQQKVIEYGLRQFDLPTRSELNSVHRQIRALKQQLAELSSREAKSQSKPQTKPQTNSKAKSGAKKAAAGPKAKKAASKRAATKGRSR